MKKITEENTRAINDCTAKAKKLLYDLNTNTINLDEFENMIKSEYKKKLDIAIELLDELKSVNPVPPRFEKSHTLSIKSFEERIEETRSRIAGDDDVSRQHGLKATEYEKQAAKETGEGMIDVMKNLIDKVDSVK